MSQDYLLPMSPVHTKAAVGFRMVNRNKWHEAGWPLGCSVRC